MKAPIVGSVPKGGVDQAGQSAALIARVGQEFAFRKNPTGFVANQQKAIQGFEAEKRAILNQFATNGEKPPPQVLKGLDDLGTAINKRSQVESIEPSVLSSLIQRGDFNPVELFRQEEQARSGLQTLIRDKVQIGQDGKVDSTAGLQADLFKRIALSKSAVEIAKQQVDATTLKRIETEKEVANRNFGLVFGGMSAKQLEEVGANGSFTKYGNAAQFNAFRQSVMKQESAVIKDRLDIANKQATLEGKKETNLQAFQKRATSNLTDNELASLLEIGRQKGNATSNSGANLPLALLEKEEADRLSVGDQVSQFKAQRAVNESTQEQFVLNKLLNEDTFTQLLGTVPAEVQVRYNQAEDAVNRRRAELEANGANALDIETTIANEFNQVFDGVDKAVKNGLDKVTASFPKEAAGLITEIRAGVNPSAVSASNYIGSVGPDALQPRNVVYKNAASVLKTGINNELVALAQNAKSPAALRTAQLKAVQLLPNNVILASRSSFEGSLAEQGVSLALRSTFNALQDQLGNTQVQERLGQALNADNPALSDFINPGLMDSFEDEDGNQGSVMSLGRIATFVVGLENEARQSDESISKGLIVDTFMQALQDEGVQQQGANETRMQGLADFAIEGILYADHVDGFLSPEQRRKKQYDALARGLDREFQQRKTIEAENLRVGEERARSIANIQRLQQQVESASTRQTGSEGTSERDRAQSRLNRARAQQQTKESQSLDFQALTILMEGSNGQ